MQLNEYGRKHNTYVNDHDHKKFQQSANCQSQEEWIDNRYQYKEIPEKVLWQNYMDYCFVLDKTDHNQTQQT